MPTVDRVLVQMKVDDLPDTVMKDAVSEELMEDPAEDTAAEEEADTDGGEASE
jgi:hypothetical protein